MRKETEQKAVAALQKHPCFAAATQEELTRLVRHESTVLREFAKGQTVFPLHTGAQAFGLLLSGSCVVKRGGRIKKSLSGGSVFALESLFGAGREQTEVYTAQTDGKALLISKTAAEELLQASFAVTQGFLAFLSAQIDALGGLAAAAEGGSAEAKTAAFLLEHKKKDGDAVAVTPDFSKLARQIGVSRDALSRAFDRLTAAGAIGLRDKGLVIKDLDKLKIFLTENEE